jgi:PAS domain S-box-containing protein
MLSLHIAIAIKNAMLHEKLGEYSQKLNQTLMNLVQSEEDKKRAQKEWGDIFQAIRNPILILDVNHNILMANPAAEKLTGMLKDELYGKKCHEIVHGIDIPAECCPIEKMLQSGQLETFEMQMETIGGVFLVSCTPVVDEKGQIEKVIHISTDITKRKQMEKALYESERKYRELVEKANSIILRWNRLGEITFMNEFGQRFFGYTEAEILGRHVVGTIVPETESTGRDLRPLMEEICLHPLKFERNINENMRRNGDRVWIDWTNKIVLNDQGELIEILSIGSDITERKELENSLQVSETRFRRLLDSIMDAFVVVDMNGSIKEFNHVYRDMLGYEQDELYSLTYKDITPEKWHKFEEEIVEKQVLPMGYSEIYQKEYRRKDGTIFPVELRTYLIKDEAGKPIGMWGIIHDITRRKRAEDELRESERRYRQLIEQAADGIFVVDPNGNYLLVNSTFYKMLRYTGDELLKLNVLDTYPDELRDVGQQRFDRVTSGENLRFERPMKRKDGTIFQVEISVSKLDDGRHQGIVRDITDRKKAEDEKKKLENELIQAQKMESIGTLAGGIAHDFNNILSAIIGYAQLAMYDVSEPEQARKELNEVLKAGDRAKDLVSQILTFSRKADARYSPISLTKTVMDSIKMMRSVLPTTIDIRHDLIDSGLVMADPTQIHQVMLNLCANAAHAMDKTGGVMEVRLRRVDIDEGPQSLEPNLPPGPYLWLSISDTGHGMTPEVMARIFDPYFTTKEIGRGTGLGLAVVHGIVQSHGGTITCASSPGKGTTFDIYLPEIMSEEAVVRQHEERPLPIGTERILFIDDEPILVELAEEMLSKLGYTVVTKSSSTEALELFQKDPDNYDLVITDMTMPGMTGDRLAQKILEIRHDIPIILCSGYSEHISEEKAKKIGIRKFVMKPLEVKELAKTIRKVLDGG